ncbi:MAG: agmatine deiminase [Enterococcus sp.]
MKLMSTSPKEDGYTIVAETLPHEECFIIWPERTDNWRNGAKPAQKIYARLAELIARFEPVTMLVSQAQYRNARLVLPESVRVLEMSSDDAWIKDTGPVYVMNEKKELRGVDFRFNAWGGLLDGLFFPWDQDDLLAEKICNWQRLDYYSLTHFILEGCSIQTDGEKTLFTTEECLLSEGRNPELTKEQIEELLKSYCGIEKVIWLKEGYFLDETNGDIDNMLNVVRPGELVLTWCDDVDDPMYTIVRDAYRILSEATDAAGRKFKIHKMPMPQPMYITEEESLGVDAVNGMLPRFPGDRLVASYVSYYIANKGIIYPTFDDPNDQPAKELLQSLYPEYTVIGLPAREILLGGGNIHCIAQALPQHRK